MFQLLRKGRSPVDVFIILSGFVIFYLLHTRNDKYNLFLIKRFFRLYPVYILCLAISIFVGLLSIENMQSLPWAAELSNSIERLQVERTLFWQHLSAHALMLHGVIPDQVLPDSTNAILTPAWSISLEWQFYLVAPVVYAFLQRSPKYFLIISGMVMLCSKFAYVVGYYPNPGFLPLKADFFWVGGVSYYVFQFLQKNKEFDKFVKWPYLIILIVSVTIIFICNHTVLIPLLIWFVVFGAVLLKSASIAEGSGSFVTDFLNNKYLRKLGEISYSTYLAHLPVIIMCQYIILKIHPELNKNEMLLILTALAAPITIIVSLLLNRTVEKPFIALGRRIADRRRSG